MASWFPAGMSSMAWMLDPPDLSDIDDNDDEVDAVVLSLSNPWADESEGNWGLWPQFQPHCGVHPHSCCPT